MSRSVAPVLCVLLGAAACAGPVQHAITSDGAGPRPTLLGTSDGAAVAISHEGGSFLLELSGAEVQPVEDATEPTFQVGDRAYRVHAHALRELLPRGRGSLSDKGILNEQWAWESAAVRAQLEASGRLTGKLLTKVTRHRTKAGVSFLVWDYVFPSEDGAAPGEVFGHIVNEQRLLTVSTSLRNLDDADKSRDAVIDVLERVELRQGALDMDAEQKRLDERDRERYAESFEKAKDQCHAGNAAACADVGYRYLFGNNGAPEDPSEARSYLQRGCDGKEPRSCLGLAGMYVTALGVPKDVAKGKALLKKACKLGLKQACTSLESLNAE